MQPPEGLDFWSDRDIPQLLALEQQAYDFPWTEGNFRDSLQGDHGGLVLRVEGLIAGYAIYQLILDEMHLLNLVVSPQHQGRGLGSRLLQGVMTLARGQACQNFFLEVRASNARALALYARQGFSPIARRRDYYPARGGREDAIIMECAL
jgi:ribosomal-protein-alanine N-acetyltransferase